ncbi:MAG: insulinase family protein [Chitinophagaceae bacterium]|jgi:predicted Zn-dependent peptidase|nr:insulinase family protein [Chitinophagaceae bacterium]
MTDRSFPPAIHNAVEFDLSLPACSRFTLDNGVPVIAVDAGVEDVLQIEWVFEAGNCFEKSNMVAGAANHLLKNGTKSRSAFDINEQIDFYGAYLNRSCFNETALVTLHTLSKHLENVLPVVTDIFTDSIFPKEELEIFVQNSKQRLSVNLRKCDFVANREMDVLLYGKDHPYGKYSTAESLDALTREQLVAFYNEYYLNGRLVIFVAGKLPSNLAEQLNAAFGHLPLKPYLPQKNEPVFEEKNVLPNRVVRIENDPNGVQGAIRLARAFPNRHHPDFQKVQVLNNLFGGFFGSRLMSNIREDKGYTYGIYSYLQNHIGPCGWVISTEAGRDVCEAAIKEVYYEMQQLREGFVDEEELLLVRNYMIGSILGSLDGPFQIIGRWKSYYLNGITDGRQYFNSAIETIKTVSPEELQVLADKWLRPEAFYEMVVV